MDCRTVQNERLWIGSPDYQQHLGTDSVVSELLAHVSSHQSIDLTWFLSNTALGSPCFGVVIESLNNISVVRNVIHIKVAPPQHRRSDQVNLCISASISMS